MKNTEILSEETSSRSIKRFRAVNPVKWILAAAAGALLTIGTAPRSNAQVGTVYSVNIVGCVPPMTEYLLTAPLTIEQRQALHAQNFYQLAPSVRPLYLHAVAYGVSLMVAGFNGEQGTMAMSVRQHLEDVSSFNGEQGTMAIYIAPAIPAEYSQFLAAHMAVVKTALQELNVKIADQVANNTSFQQAMYAGAVYGFWDYDWWW